ncbi:helicase associated domain-containing protein [Streptomyces sp. 147326]|uniref:helicase associated domain-containing protein n=1 Tax=Streptomyces sp. 147326 TaxID=3074379 RepID=UPI0038574BFA
MGSASRDTRPVLADTHLAPPPHPFTLRYRQREGDLNVPYEHVETARAFPLGRWLSDQRRAHRAGTMTGELAAELEEVERGPGGAGHPDATPRRASRTHPARP